MGKTYKEVAIPFTGFYNSDHDAVFDDHLEMEIYNFQTEYDATDEQIEAYQNAFFAIDWKQAHTEYAEEYCKALFYKIDDETGLKLDYKFKALESPRFYNFETDRIFCDINEEDLYKLLKIVKKEYSAIMNSLVSNKFTSYNGFTSFYPSAIDAWPKFCDWDHNQLGTLLECFIIANIEEDELKAWDLMGDLSCNGGIYEMIDSADKEGNLSRISNEIYTAYEEKQKQEA